MRSSKPNPDKFGIVGPILEAAYAAGEILLYHYQNRATLGIQAKTESDFVSKADFDSQQTIRKILSAAALDFGFLMEEKDGHAPAEACAKRFIVDPLDGTTNFLRGIPFWAVSIAAEVEGEIIAGVVYSPLTGEVFWATRDGGAFEENTLHGTPGKAVPLKVSGTKSLAPALIGTGIPFKGIDAPAYNKQFMAVRSDVAGIRRLGAMALDLVYLAAGKFDALWAPDLKPHDIAAGLLIAQEAGAKISSLDVADPRHGRVDAATKELLISNPHLHEAMLARTLDLSKLLAIPAVICRGHGAASGMTANPLFPCEDGAVKTIANYLATSEDFRFKDYTGGHDPFWGTLNCYIGGVGGIDPLTYIHTRPSLQKDERILSPDNVKWVRSFKHMPWHPKLAEDISYLSCWISYDNKTYPALLSYVDSRTKKHELIPDTILEIIAPKIDFGGSSYGRKVTLLFRPDSMRLKTANKG